jgi:hypothetical protein
MNENCLLLELVNFLVLSAIRWRADVDVVWDLVRSVTVHRARTWRSKDVDDDNEHSDASSNCIHLLRRPCVVESGSVPCME